MKSEVKGLRARRAAKWGFLIPAGLYVLFAFVIPIVYNLILSFEQTSLASISHLFAPSAGVSCPRCGSRETERLSEFGSTACKALCRCRACREPFDHFKCV